jgi:4-hydroxyproline epimerase
VIFFNNVGYLGMCGHGTIGLVVTLAHMGRIGCGKHRIETPVGTVSALLDSEGKVTVHNVHSYRLAAKVPVHVPGFGEVTGDVAWAGNWFFLIEKHGMVLDLKNVEALTDFTWAVRPGTDGCEHHRGKRTGNRSHRVVQPVANSGNP